MAKFRLAPAAEEHVGSIVAFIATDNESAAVRVRNALYTAFDLLALQPGIGHSRQDITKRPLKFWSVYSYLIVYDPASLPLTIVAILHGARDIDQLREDLTQSG